jgi:hypothetical protein
MYTGRVLEAFRPSTLIYDLGGSGTSHDTKINRSILLETINHNPKKKKGEINWEKRLCFQIFADDKKSTRQIRDKPRPVNTSNRSEKPSCHDIKAKIKYPHTTPGQKSNP